MNTPDTLMVLSGGLDSVTMLHEFRSRIALAVYFNYGSNHAAPELACARWQCERLGIELVEIPLAFIGQHFESALLSGADAIPDGEYATDNMTATVVPFRNGIMLAAAAGLAESRGLKTVMIANHAGDHAIYPDCRPTFIQAMANAIAAGTYAQIELLAPYTNLSKSDIARRGKEMGVDYSHTYSCYRGTPTPCGHCATCRERRQALLDAGLDPDL